MVNNKSDLLGELKLLIRSRYGLIVIDTKEEERAGLLIKLLADQMNLPLLSRCRSPVAMILSVWSSRFAGMWPSACACAMNYLLRTRNV